MPYVFTGSGGDVCVCVCVRTQAVYISAACCRCRKISACYFFFTKKKIFFLCFGAFMVYKNKTPRRAEKKNDYRKCFVSICSPLQWFTAFCVRTVKNIGEARVTKSKRKKTLLLIFRLPWIQRGQRFWNVDDFNARAQNVSQGKCWMWRENPFWSFDSGWFSYARLYNSPILAVSAMSYKHDVHRSNEDTEPVVYVGYQERYTDIDRYRGYRILDVWECFFFFFF